MTDLKKIYQEMTSVDLDEQKRIWDERGKGYYGEFLVMQDLYLYLRGESKLLMNLEIPADDGKKTEIDLLLIHETGLYVFEVKYYKGTIYGKYDDSSWTQYFRTKENNRFLNPIRQNERHIAALKRLYPDLPTYSYVVFTNDEGKLKVSGEENSGVRVCTIWELPACVTQINSLLEKVMNGEQIDARFRELSVYSHISRETVSMDGKEVPLIDYMGVLKTETAQKVEQMKAAEKRSYKRKVTSIVIAALIICAIAIVGALTAWGILQNKAQNALAVQMRAQKELAEFSKKFQEAEPMNGGKIQLEDNFFEVTSANLEKSADLKDTYLFRCSMRVNGEQYGVRIHRDSSIIVQMIDGTVTEYVLGKLGVGFYERTVVAYAPGAFYNTADLPEIAIYTSSPDNVRYIKLTNIGIVKSGSLQTDVLPGTEFTLYSAN